MVALKTYGHGFIAATRINSAGNVVVAFALEIIMSPDFSGCLRTARTSLFR